MPGSLSPTTLHHPILRWYAANARDLPWRAAEATPWQILISEVMLQQTPVNRVLPVYEDWVRRWPTPAALAAEPSGEAVRHWGRLGYPRRALRLHAAAVAMVQRHNGQVPSDIEQLRALPGIGEYTAAAVASFAYRQRHPVLDTNVRRVFARAVHGQQYPSVSATAAERRAARELLPDQPETAARWGVAVMELGALVCVARTPRCADCPIRTRCAWRLAGRPAHDGPKRKVQQYDGTDRQCRGALLAVLRNATAPVSAEQLRAAWADHAQRDRALTSLLTDGLVTRTTDGHFALPI